jgi:hypothetical protein
LPRRSTPSSRRRCSIWKICENLGPTLRVSIVVEEAEPGIVEARINSRPVLRILVPWHESHGFGERPASAAAAQVAVLNFRERLLAALTRGIGEWRRDNLGNREAEDASLTGVVSHGSADSAAPWALRHRG